MVISRVRTSLANAGSDPDTVMESSEIPPLIRPRSPTGLHSMVGANPVLQRQWKPPKLFAHSVDARSH